MNKLKEKALVLVVCDAWRIFVAKRAIWSGDFARLRLKLKQSFLKKKNKKDSLKKIYPTCVFVWLRESVAAIYIYILAVG